VQHARRTGIQRRGVLAGFETESGRFDADQLDTLVGNVGVEQADGVRTAPTQAITASGWRPVISGICFLASSPMTDWKSRTIMG